MLSKPGDICTKRNLGLELEKAQGQNVCIQLVRPWVQSSALTIKSRFTMNYSHHGTKLKYFNNSNRLKYNKYV